MCKKVEIQVYQSHVGRNYEHAKNSTLSKLPEENKDHMMFKNEKNKLKRSYIVYADTECSLVPTGLAAINQKHVPK